MSTSTQPIDPLAFPRASFYIGNSVWSGLAASRTEQLQVDRGHCLAAAGAAAPPAPRRCPFPRRAPEGCLGTYARHDPPRLVRLEAVAQYGYQVHIAPIGRQQRVAQPRLAVRQVEEGRGPRGVARAALVHI